MNIQEIKSKSISELISLTEKYGMINNSNKNKRDLIFSLIKYLLNNTDQELVTEGVLEVLQDGFGFLRSPEANYLPGVDDIYVSPMQIKRLSLNTGNIIEGKIRSLQNGEKYISLSRILKVNNQDPKLNRHVASFDNLVPLYPQEQLLLEIPDKKNVTGRIIDLVAPMGKGQRALIVSPPRAGKTMILQSIAKSIEVNHPEISLIVLLIDERPEEVTDMQRSVKGEVISSTFDEPAHRHVQIAEVVLEKVKRLTENGKDVVVLLDSITRLARAYNTIVPSSGKILTGGVDANALQRPKRFLGAARNIDHGGSLSIIATALVDTGSKMDEVIFEEFKGTGNCELVIDRRLADKRIFPAIDVLKSGTRKEELLVKPDILSKMWILRRVLTNMGAIEGMEFLLNKICSTDSNKKFFDSMKGN